MAPTASVVSSLCMLTSCAAQTESPETNTLLQRTRIKSHLQDARTGVAAGTAASELRLLESLATSVVKEGAKIDDETKNTIKDLIANELKKSKEQIQAAHNADVQAGATFVSNWNTNCQTVFETAQSTFAEKLAEDGATYNKHDNHGQCRAQWRIDDGKRDTECKELTGHNAGLRASWQEIVADIPSGRKHWATWWAQVKAFADGDQTWRTIDKECRDAETKEDQTLASCNTKQRTFENAMCTDKLAHDLSCETYENCYAQGVGDLNAARNDAEAGANSRKIEWEAIIKIECFANLLLNEGGETQSDGSDKLTVESLNECKNKVVNTDHLDVMTTDPAFPGGLPAPTACNRSPLDAYGGHPCTANFESTSYAGITDIVEDCVPCSTGTVWTRTIDPAQATYSQMEQYCADTGRRICTRAEICPNGHHPGAVPDGGKASGDSWVPVSDEVDQWVQTGDAYWPSCQLHTEIAGGVLPKPEWSSKGGEKHAHGFRHDLCCI